MLNSSCLTTRTTYTISLSWLILITSCASGTINPNLKLITADFLSFTTICCIFFYSSIYLTATIHTTPWIKTSYLSKKNIKHIFYLATILIIIFKLTDRLLLRAPSEVSIASFREAREIESNIFSVVVAAAFPLYIVYYDKFKSQIKNKYIFLTATFIISADIVLSGSRGSLLVIATYLFAKNFSFKKILILTPLAAMASALFFNMRFESLSGPQQNITETLTILSTEGYAEFVPASDWIISKIQGEHSNFYFAIVQLIQYATHSIFEFAYIFNTQAIRKIDLTQILPMLNKITTPTNLPERTGMYYTLFGSTYLSFGIYSIAAMIPIGIIFGAALKYAKKISTGATTFVLFCIFLSPFVNSLAAYDIFFYLTSILLISKINLQLDKNKHDNTKTSNP